MMSSGNGHIPSLAELFGNNSSTNSQSAKIPSLSELLAQSSSSDAANSIPPLCSNGRQLSQSSNPCSIPSLGSLSMMLETPKDNFKFTSLNELSTSPGNFVSLSQLSKSPGKPIKPMMNSPPILHSMKMDSTDLPKMKEIDHRKTIHSREEPFTLTTSLSNMDRMKKEKRECDLPTLFDMLNVTEDKDYEKYADNCTSASPSSTQVSNKSQPPSFVSHNTSNISTLTNQSNETMEANQRALLRKSSKFSKVICSHTTTGVLHGDGDKKRSHKPASNLLPKEVVFYDITPDIGENLFTFSSPSPDDIVLGHQKKAFEREA